ncbi:MAG TPA: hypothetical protein VL020_04915 [Pseudomonadales bacterium]|jgi:hypothetical protein|nr:hypothetical protein [Pseudomonadales bacterium]
MNNATQTILPNTVFSVLKSAAGFYIGTACPVEGPISRESQEYWSTETQAEKALQTGQWTQRLHP